MCVCVLWCCLLLSVVDFDVCQLEKQRLNVASTDRRKYNDLTDAIAVLRAAEKLTVQNIAVANVIATQEAAQIVLDAGHAFPLPNKMMFCKMWCIDLMENHKHQEWGECVTPILRPDSTPRKWGVKQPLWGCNRARSLRLGQASQGVGRGCVHECPVEHD